MSRIRGTDTGPELSLRHTLYGMGYRYRLHSRELPGRPDIVFAAAKVAVFVHGCFWHGCPDHYSAPKNRARFWRNKLDANRKRDRLIHSELKRMGWKVIEFWEHEVDSNPRACATRVRMLLNSVRPRRNPSPPRRPGRALRGVH